MSNPEKSGDSSDPLLSNPEAVMKIWFQYNSRDFIQLIVHETKQEIFVIETLLKILLDDSSITNLSVNSILGTRTVEENCTEIMQRLARLRQITSIAWEYSETQKDTKT